jgi:hypothetical protein
MTKAEKALIEVAMKWESFFISTSGCGCLLCLLGRAVRRVVKERRKGK